MTRKPLLSVWPFFVTAALPVSIVVGLDVDRFTIDDGVTMGAMI